MQQLVQGELVILTAYNFNGLQTPYKLVTHNKLTCICNNITVVLLYINFAILFSLAVKEKYIGLKVQI